MSNKQKALVLPSKHGQFTVDLVDIPKPGHGQVLVKVEAAALNPVDHKIQQYGVVINEYPAILGQDIAGTVENIGEGVNQFKKGDRVYVMWRSNSNCSHTYEC